MSALEATGPADDPWTGFSGWGDVAADGYTGEGAFHRFVRRFRQRKVAIFALVLLAFFVVVAILAPWLEPFDPKHPSLRRADQLRGPGWGHWLGTDNLGRDVLSRMISGSRVSLLAALEATVVALVIGVPLGLIAGYFGGWIDAIISRITDAVMSFPPLLLAIGIVGVFGPNLTNAMLAIGFIFSPRFLRLTRSSVLSVRQETYIEASKSVGTSTFRILRTRILPNILSPLVVQTSLSFGFAILAEASLSFLGLGVQPPQPSWGSMVGQGYQFIQRAPTLIIFPGLAIVLAVLAFNLLGDGLRDSFGRETRSGSK